MNAASDKQHASDTRDGLADRRDYDADHRDAVASERDATAIRRGAVADDREITANQRQYRLDKQTQKNAETQAAQEKRCFLGQIPTAILLGSIIIIATGVSANSLWLKTHTERLDKVEVEVLAAKIALVEVSYIKAAVDRIEKKIDRDEHKRDSATPARSQ